MRIELLPQPELLCLINRLLENLNSGAGEHKKAQLCFDLNQDVDPARDETPSFRRGMMQSADEDAIRQGKLFVAGNASKEIFSLLTESVKSIDPLYWFKGTFEQKEADWVYVLQAQSCSEYKQLCLERKPLEDALEPLMLAAAQEIMPDWKELDFSCMQPKQKLRIICTGAKGVIKDAVVKEEAANGYETIKNYYRSKGFTLGSFKMELLGGPKKKIREIMDSYL